MWANWVSDPTLVACTTRRPPTEIVPPMTASPGPTSAGKDSPVIALRSIAESPKTTSPSVATVSPGRTTNWSPIASSLDRDRALDTRRVEHRHVLCAERGERAQGVAGLALLAIASKYRPARRKVVTPAATSMYMAPPAWWVMTNNSDRAARLVSRQNIAYNDQPVAAAIPIDTSVSIVDTPCRAPRDRRPVERPGRPGDDRRSQRDEQPLPIGKPDRGNERERERRVTQRHREEDGHQQPAAERAHPLVDLCVRRLSGTAGAKGSAENPAERISSTTRSTGVVAPSTTLALSDA